MGQTRKQNKRERIAKLCDEIGGKNSRGGKELRSTNRRVDKSKKFK